jgi:hypothetical protein
MREGQPPTADSLADSLIRTGALLDGRYRLDGLVRRSTTTTIHVATHRNGSTAWLKLPVSAAHAGLLALEAGIANSTGSPLVVRDDGMTSDGIFYLVLDPPEAESVAALRARAKTGARRPLARIMTAGDALARVVGSIHAMGYVTAGLADEDVLVFANGDVALLDLHAMAPATAPGIAADVKHVLRVLSELVSDVADTTAPAPARALIDGALAAAYPDVPALQAAWRAAAPEPIALPSRVRSGSLADIPSAPNLAAHDTPQSMSLDDDTQRASDGSVIGYLRSGGAPSVRPAAVGPRERPVMYDPLSKAREMPRLVQATSRAPEPGARSPMSRALVGTLIGTSLMALIAGTVVLSASSGSSSPHGVSATALEAPVPPVSVLLAPAAPAPLDAPVAKASPPAAAVVAAAPPPAPSTMAADPDEELQLTTLLRTENAPLDREVFVDGKPVGKTPLSVSVPCGSHTLQMMAGAPKQPVELPCGGKRVVRYDAKGRWSLRAE